MVLFDFDGTLVDSAPDLANSANYLRLEKGLAPLPLAYLRPYASMGARGLLKAALDLDMDHPDFEPQKQIFLDHYAANSTVHSQLFEGVESLIQQLNAHRIPWGVVTNKALGLTLPIMRHFALLERSAVTIGGDCTPHLKPNPASLFLACERTGVAPEQCVYIGDDERDIVAGKAAGMTTMVAAYGYCHFDPAIPSWQANWVANHADDIFPLLEQHWL